MGRILLDDVIDAIAPKSRRAALKRRARVIVATLTGVLALLVMRKQRWAPIQAATAGLLLPSPLSNRNDRVIEGRRIMTKLHVLKKQLVEVSTGSPEETRLHEQIGLLEEIITGG